MEADLRRNVPVLNCKETDDMKLIFITIALFGVIFSANLWAHHAAEGIVSDEIWQKIDDNLVDAESPHLENFTLDRTDTMDGATIYTDPETGDMYLLTVSQLYYEGDLTEELWKQYVLDYIDEVVLPSLDESNQIPSGTLNEDTSTVIIDWKLIDSSVPTDDTTDYAEILVYEPIGNGRSQESAGATPVTTDPGKRSGG